MVYANKEINVRESIRNKVWLIVTIKNNIFLVVEDHKTDFHNYIFDEIKQA
jgi:hypothetical protein